MSKRLLLSLRHDANVRNESIDSLEHSYQTFWSKQGWHILLMPNGLENYLEWLDEFSPDAMVFTGGGDILPLTSHPSREKAETQALRYAIAHNTPVLGICRGMHMLNLHFGGRLHRNITQQGLHNKPGETHSLSVTHPRLTGHTRISVCNSYHDNGFFAADVAPELKIFAMAETIVEGIYHPTQPILGVQWHPERINAPTDLDIVLLTAFASRTLFWKNS